MELKQLRKQILMFLYSKGWRYLARDKFMYLRVYKNKPIKLENMIEWGDVGCINGSGSLMQFSELSDDVSWEDTEPLDIRKELGDSIFEKVNKYEGLRKYLADVCYYIDFLFSVVFIIYVVRWAFGYADNLLTMYISCAGVLLWPNKKYWEKWLNIESTGEKNE